MAKGNSDGGGSASQRTQPRTPGAFKEGHSELARRARQSTTGRKTALPAARRVKRSCINRERASQRAQRLLYVSKSPNGSLVLSPYLTNKALPAIRGLAPTPPYFVRQVVPRTATRRLRSTDHEALSFRFFFLKPKTDF